MSDIRVVLADDHPVVGQVWPRCSDPCGALRSWGWLPMVVRRCAKWCCSARTWQCSTCKCPARMVSRRHEEITRVAPEVAVLVLTMFDDDDSVFAAMRAGARGYVVKGAEQEEIGRAITAVASGEAIFGPGIAQRVLRFFATPATAVDSFPELTAPEREILDLLAAAMPNSMIATRLGLSPKTVANHLSSIFTKLQVADRAQAILRARNAGLEVGRTSCSAYRSCA
jgi:DNA-binding NarL/FixJ family response regulator